MLTCNSTKLTSVPIIAYNSNVHFAWNDPFSHLRSHILQPSQSAGSRAVSRIGPRATITMGHDYKNLTLSTYDQSDTVDCSWARVRALTFVTYCGTHPQRYVGSSCSILASKGKAVKGKIPSLIVLLLFCMTSLSILVREQGGCRLTFSR